MNYLKSVGAVLAGFLVVVVLSMGTDWALETFGIFPPASDQGLYITWMLALALFYRTVYTILGGYMTATLAPGRPMRHVYVLGFLGTLGGIAGVVAGWNLSDHWYPIALAVLAFPSVWFGGWLFTKGKILPAFVAKISTASQPRLPENNQITITRIIDAPRQKVWDAWTKPALLAQWFGTPPMTARPETTSIDFRVGGLWRADMVNDTDGTRMPFGGKYLAIDPPRKIVFTFEDTTKQQNENVETVTVTFKDRVGTTEMTLHQEGHLPAEQYGDPLRQGYNSFFDRMIALVRTMR